MILDTDSAYMAGMIDGEGCIAISKRMAKGGISYSYRNQLQVSNTIRSALEELQIIWGGRIHTSWREPRGRDCHALHLSAGDSMACLDACYPYLRIKRPQVDIVRAFRATFEGPQSNPLQAPVLAERERCYRALMQTHGGTKVRQRLGWND
jgi:hypothetical protein